MRRGRYVRIINQYKMEWDVCPPEILCTIFEYLDTRALTQCMLVCKKWRDIAEHVIKHLGIWKYVIKKEMINKGYTFTKKSTLDLRNIYRNSLLWNHVEMTDIKLVNIYEVESIKKINMYKDKLILITGSHVMYYDIHTFSLITVFESDCLDYDENDFMIIQLVREELIKETLLFYCKSDPNEMLDRSSWHHEPHEIQSDVGLYRLEGNTCYVYIGNSNDVLLAFKHKKGRFKERTIARHYGNMYDPVRAIHVWNKHVYVITKWGTVWYGESRTRNLVKMYNLRVPGNLIHHFWTMFDKYSCVMPVNNNQRERVEITYDIHKDVITYLCLQLNCAMQHGDALFLGYRDGTVEIRIPKKDIGRSEPDRTFNVRQFREMEDYTIIGIEVCEIENSHMLLVSTRDHVFQILLTYPEILLT